MQRSVEDEKVLKFLSERKPEVEGHYAVPLLWKDQNIQLPDNRVVAIHLLGLLEKRLQHYSELGEAYKKTIDTDLEKWYIKTLTKEETADQAKRTWCLPHHLVLNLNKPGKIRRVCDAAANYQGFSLNSHLVSGPDLLNNLVVIFMRFIEEKIALSGDIKRQCLTNLLSHQRIKLPSVFCGVNHRSLKSKSISTCDISLGLSVH